MSMRLLPLIGSPEWKGQISRKGFSPTDCEGASREIVGRGKLVCGLDSLVVVDPRPHVGTYGRRDGR